MSMRAISVLQTTSVENYHICRFWTAIFLAALRSGPSGDVIYHGILTAFKPVLDRNFSSRAEVSDSQGPARPESPGSGSAWAGSGFKFSRHLVMSTIVPHLCKSLEPSSRTRSQDLGGFRFVWSPDHPYEFLKWLLSLRKIVGRLAKFVADILAVYDAHQRPVLFTSILGIRETGNPVTAVKGIDVLTGPAMFLNGTAAVKINFLPSFGAAVVRGMSSALPAQDRHGA
ncbi:hypothetical protein DFH08DRAFT_811454 [Mycena albidolilacea]|uniref:Uncharacterized protein n=1 Tax=Mycena albidolilacea TaxID=1033008 RepID=A0AAD6ZVC1_9AGAR|nr:hypothetical protein DFH08DRAFT_811454 [Mycena albidolilacea]